MNDVLDWFVTLPAASLILLAVIAGLVCICVLASTAKYRGPMGR